MTRQIKYRAIRNATYDPAEARRAREWSVDRIEQYYGIRVPKRLPKLRPIPRSESHYRRLRAAALLRLRKYHYLRAYGIPSRIARKLKNLSWQDIYSYIEDQEYDEEPKWEVPDEPEQRARKKWNKWSQAAAEGRDEFPDWVKDMAAWINGEEGLDENARYGYAVVWSAYVLGVDVETARQTLAPDDYAGNFYEGLEKLL